MNNLFGKIKSIKEKVVKKVQNLSRPKIALLMGFIILVILIPLGFGIYRYTNGGSLGLYSNYLAVTSVSPEGYNISPSTKIVVNFNRPVTAHHVQYYFSITPAIDGRLEQGTSPNQVVFTPTTKFEPGTYVTVLLGTGLPSDSGKKLSNDYTFNFSISLDSATITFLKNDLSGKFMSFQQDKGVDLDIRVGSEINQPKLKIFKANEEMVLSSLSYRKDPLIVSGNYGTFIENEIDTSKLTLVKEQNIPSDNPKVNFKNEVGLYLFQALDGENVVNNVWVTLNKTGIHLRQDDQNVYLAAQDLATSTPVDGIDVKFYSLDDKPTVLAEHTLGSIQQYPFEYPKRVDIIIAKKGDDILLIPVSIPNSQAEIAVYKNLSKENRIFLYTDRPIYKKGDKVSFRGIVRADNDASYLLPSAESKVRVFFGGTYSGDKEIFAFDKIFDVSENGSFSGETTIPQDIQEGMQYFYATSNLTDTKSYTPYYTYFDVAEYKKPKFGLDITIDKDEYIKGDKVKSTLSGNFFDGNPFANETVTYSVYKNDYYETEKAVYNKSFNLNSWGGMCGGGFGGADEYYGQQIEKEKEIRLDRNGKATIEFDTSKIKSNISQELTLVIFREDENKNKIASVKRAIVHNGDFNIFFRPGPNAIESEAQFTQYFYAEKLSGEKITVPFSYSLVQENYNSTTSENDKISLKQGSTSTDTNGLGKIVDSYKTSDDKGLYLEVSAKDSRGNVILGRKYLSFYPKADKEKPYAPYQYRSNSQTQLKITSLKSNLTPGVRADLDIEAPADMKVLLSFERGRVYLPQWLDLKIGPNKISFDVPDNFMPSITPTFSFFNNGKYYIEGLSLNVPALKKLLSVEVTTDKPKYNPGDTALVTITTKDENNNLISADLGVGIVDKAIFALRKNATPPIHSTFYEFRPRATNSSSSLTWIATFNYGGGGGGGGGGDLFNKDVDTLYWNAQLKTGTDGKITIPIPVGDTQTTWKVLTYVSTSDSKMGQGDGEFLVAK